MEFWIVLAVILTLVISYPYIRCLFKRVRLCLKLREVCRRRKFGLYGTHPLWFLGTKRGKACDFYIETKNEILSVKLFGTGRRASILVFTDDGQYFIRYFLAFIANTGSSLRMPIDGRKKGFRKYDFRRGFRSEWEIKTPKNLLLVNPVCHAIHKKPQHGEEILLGAGNFVNDTVLTSASRLAGYLEVAE